MMHNFKFRRTTIVDRGLFDANVSNILISLPLAAHTRTHAHTHAYGNLMRHINTHAYAHTDIDSSGLI